MSDIADSLKKARDHCLRLSQMCCKPPQPGNIAAVKMRSYAFSMSYKIRYFRDGSAMRTSIGTARFPKPVRPRAAGIKRNRAEYATILDLDRDAKRSRLCIPTDLPLTGFHGACFTPP
jgi:hypothetical protein